jgi:hypothetical protein
VHCPVACPICDQHNKDDWHFLFDCNDNILAWQKTGLDVVILSRVICCNNEDERMVENLLC